MDKINNKYKKICKELNFNKYNTNKDVSMNGKHNFRYMHEFILHLTHVNFIEIYSEASINKFKKGIYNKKIVE